MAMILSGKDVAAAMRERLGSQARRLRDAGTVPTLAVLRVGEKEDQIAYERGAAKRCEGIGIEVRHIRLPETCSQEELLGAIRDLNADAGVHGVLMLSPLPAHLDLDEAAATLDPRKDVDAATTGSLAGVFAGSSDGFAPCTAQACLEILKHYGIEAAGKHVAVLGRSLVIGRPVAMLLLHENATPTICHSRTGDAPALTRAADMVIVAIGRAESIGAQYFSAGQTVIDVGTNWSDEKGRLVGDVRFDEVESLVGAITPVPGGVGAVTTSVLASHVIEAAGA
ncbi:MAG: tetrahydrofolate dehydrogenase/cyclohydrolase catalytic domain-containing protein [Berryella intestinalis]|uniref:bifunctional 5,10-methylenetetrahydrofolate dehydrogenase/5,10-methenyltetrahydrofolate cyclohydrolase n=1 Tax=Berryella intestinalis TaxID=1531429 RepID=UPI002A595625|nr:tetrahydrofolate dehydrogenase/cyclohydrolase catalytic domain-containing protein [Berryella intestinalis]MDD7368646.1 tetrahydrofolate dehydrogenase/cyclohydrolase catalytic domain-containing protein [Berryella intestinalis]MDY3129218.1 tetrahydrofolate dehydrogenase/cyclohydrolase catalytic domain-containing protein [Berryella intestinalis]